MSRKPELVRESTITKVIKGMITSGAKPGRVDVRPDGSFTILIEDCALAPNFPDAQIAPKATA
jgi:hypothetical protein